MAAEAINLYMNLVIVLGRKIQHFVLKSAIVSWSEYMYIPMLYTNIDLFLVTPLFIVLLCFAPNYENYMSDPSHL